MDRSTLYRHIERINTLDTYINELTQNESVLMKSIHHEPNNQFWPNMLQKSQRQSLMYRQELMQTILDCHPTTDNEDLHSIWKKLAVQYMPTS